MSCSRRAITAAILYGVVFNLEALAQQFPTQPIHLILGFAPGGITDFTGRVVAQQLSKILGGNSVVPENRPGAAGINAAAAVAHARADGYTLILIDPGTVVNPMLRSDARYKMSDFTMVGMVGSSPVVIVASNELPVRNINELNRLRHQQPRQAEFCHGRHRERTALGGGAFREPHRD